MKKILLFALLLPLLSCQKDKPTVTLKTKYKTINSKVEYNKPILIDLNDDSVIDYRINAELIESNNVSSLYFSIISSGTPRTNKILILPTEETPSDGWVVAYDNGIEISSNAISPRSWDYSKGFLVGIGDNGLSKSYSGNYANKGDKYIGLKFKIGDNYHYGWMRINHSTNNEFIEVKDCAYYLLADKSIKTGEK